MKLLLDTNVLIDYFARRDPFFDDAVKLRIAQAFGDVELWACMQSYLDVLYILHGAIPQGTLVKQLESSLDFMNLCTPDDGDLRYCLANPWNDIEDQMIDRGAQRVQADYLVTRDAGDFKRAKTTVRTPRQVLDELHAEGFSYDMAELWS